MKFFNGCDSSAIEALRYLASNPRPAGGQHHFNAEHLLQIANELEKSLKPNQVKNVRVTIEEKGLEPLVVEFDHVAFEQERGLNTIRENPWVVSDFEPNGQERMLIKLYTGCSSYDRFNPGTR
jgi:hypothetical protein